MKDQREEDGAMSQTMDDRRRPHPAAARHYSDCPTLFDGSVAQASKQSQKLIAGLLAADPVDQLFLTVPPSIESRSRRLLPSSVMSRK